MPDISIVVPVHNSAPFLDGCLGSLAAMAFDRFEVIAVDDGSEDDSWVIIEEFARRDPRFARSFRAACGGPGPTRNRGLEIARGDYVAFVDSDDSVDPDYCCAPYALACEQRADLVLFGSWWLYPDHRELHLPDCRADMTPQELLLHTSPVVWEKLYRRTFLQSRNLTFPAIHHEDEAFTPVLMAHAPRIAVLDRPLYSYFKRDGSITGLKVNPKSADLLQASRILIEQSLTLPMFRPELEYYAFRVLRWMASRWRESGEDWARACLQEAEHLLGTIDHPGTDNPYLLRERAKAQRRRRPLTRLGRNIRREASRLLRLLRLLCGARRPGGIR